MSPPFALVLAEQAVKEFFGRWCDGLRPLLLLEPQPNGDIFVMENPTHAIKVLLISDVKHGVPKLGLQQKLLPTQLPQES